MKYFKNISILTTLCVTFITLQSCRKNVLDTQPLDRISDDVVWSNKANAETFLFSTYGTIMYRVAPSVTTDAYTTNLLGFDGPYNSGYGVFAETIDRFSDFGFNNWSAVRRCNLIMEKVGNSDNISEEDKKQLIAEAKFLRAISYFDVARKIGRIVWIDKVLTPEDELLLPSTKNTAESYRYIIKDLEEAYNDLSADKISGRANKYVAAAFLSEISLQALAYQDYPNPMQINSNDPLLEKAIKYANIVINEGGYSLTNEYGSMFNEISPTSDEIIFGIYRQAINTTVDGTPMQLMVPNMNNDHIKTYGGSPLLNSNINIFEAWVQHGPTQNLANEYLVIDAQNPNIALPWNQTSQYKAAIEENISVPTSSIPTNSGENIVVSGHIKAGSNESIWTLSNINRDARWKESIIGDSTSLFYGEMLTTCVNGNATRYLKTTGLRYYMSLSNMYWRKGVYTNIKPRVYVGVPTDYHYVVTRLGRVYLNLAEAYLLKKDIANAVTALNKTRITHGKLPPSNASNLQDAWTDYKRERRVDLTLENDYYWSLLRWGRYGQEANHNSPSGSTIKELTEIPQIIDISKDRMYFKVLSGSFFGQNNNRTFNPSRRYLFPIAQGFLDNNLNFGPQNTGW